MRTVIVGLDAFDPVIFEKLAGQGRMPNLAKYIQSGGYSRLAVANPPQSEVSWTSIASGVDPGSHGIFDFVHRDPVSYTPFVSLLPTRQQLGATQFVPPFTARTLFDQAVQDGFPATSLWWPATFPARPESPVHTIPGLGTPDIQGRLGVGALYSTDPELGKGKFKTPVEPLRSTGRSRFTGVLKGPARGQNGRSEHAEAPFSLDFTDPGHPRISIDKATFDLLPGVWSPIIEINFKLGLLFQVKAVTRLILTQTGNDPQLYFLPLQIHPLHTAWRYATPPGFVRQIWKSFGPFLTIGWPQDTTALEEGWINDEQFLDLCTSIVSKQEQVLNDQVQRFSDGVLACVFDTLDRVQHMFFRDRQDVIEDWYTRLDGLAGRVEAGLARSGKSQARLLVVSDHGFGNFDYKVHLNRWLIQQGYLTPIDGSQSTGMRAIDWKQTRSYAIGLNSLYLNLEGREGQGCVSPGERDSLLGKIEEGLRAWTGPDGQPVVQSLERNEKAFSGPVAEYGPDLVIGYTPGYRASAQTGLGEWEEHSIERNKDHWGADHCFAPQAVPGVLFSSQELDRYTPITYREIPVLAIGKHPDPGHVSPPPGGSSGEDQDILEERLRSLGYL